RLRRQVFACILFGAAMWIPSAGLAQTPGAIGRSTSSVASRPFSGVLTMREALDRGLEHNLAIVGLMHATDEARSQQQIARSLLLPNVIGSFSTVEQQVNLAALGVRFDTPIPGVSLPEVVGPFNVVDLRARVAQ